MRLSLLTAGAASALLLFQVPVMAQSNTNQHNGGATAEQSVNPTTGSSSAAGISAHGSIRTQLQTMLQNQGYSDVRVMPSSFLVRAKDKEGSPVVMSVSPDSITEVAEVGSQRADPEASANSSSNSSAGQFVAIPNTDELSSNVVGLDVYNNDNKNVGQIKDVAWNQHDHAQAYIVSVGGFLGVGTHYVAVNPQDVKISYNDSDKKWHAAMNATADQLKAAPEFKYAPLEREQVVIPIKLSCAYSASSDPFIRIARVPAHGASRLSKKNGICLPSEGRQKHQVASPAAAVDDDRERKCGEASPGEGGITSEKSGYRTLSMAPGSEEEGA